jgi:hypothetical protein
MSNPLFIDHLSFQAKILPNDRGLSRDGVQQPLVGCRVRFFRFLFAEHRDAVEPPCANHRHDQPNLALGEPSGLPSGNSGFRRQRNSHWGSQALKLCKKLFADWKGRPFQRWSRRTGEPHLAPFSPPQVHGLGVKGTLQSLADESGHLLNRVELAEVVEQAENDLFAVVLFPEKPLIEPPNQRRAELQAQARGEDPIEIGAASRKQFRDGLVAMRHEDVEQSGAGQCQHRLESAFG